MRNFIIERIYGEDDPEFVFDALEVRLYDSEGNIVMAGDWYHDKIDEKIGGFFETPLIRLTDDIENLGLKNDEEREDFLK